MELERVLRKVLPRTKIAYVSDMEPDRPSDIRSKKKTEDRRETVYREAPSDWMTELREAGINTTSGLQYSREDAEFYRQVVEKFAGDYEKNKEKLAEFYEHRDAENYRISVHSLKSTSKMIGADALSGQAKEAEDAAKNGNFAYLDAHHE